MKKVKQSSRRILQLVLLGLLIFQSNNIFGQANVAQAGTLCPIGAGLDGISDYGNSRWFVDAMKYSREFGQFDRANDLYTGTFNPTTHYPTQSFGLIIIMGANPTYEAFLFGTYKLSFNGQATVITSSSAAIVSNQVYNSTTGVTTADVEFVTNKDNQIWLKFSNPVNMNNLKLISPGYPANSTQLIRNEWVSVLSQFNMFRMMDWLATNNNPVVSWDDRHLNSLPGRTNRDNKDAGCSWDDVCAFANQLNKDIWINIPAKADNNYITQCAELLKNKLNPNINVYVEWSNEVWNFSFGQFSDNLSASDAEVAAGGSTLNNDGNTDRFTWARRRVVRRNYEVSNIFKSVWGASSINTRIRCVVAGQLGFSHGGVNGDLEWLNKNFGAPKTFFWGIANAPYFNPNPVDNNNTSATVSQLLDQLEVNKNALFDNRSMDGANATAAYYGLELMSYEGGPDTFGPNNIQAKSVLAFDPRMKTITADFLTRWYKNGGKQYNWFVIGCGGNSWSSQYGTWSLLHWFGDSDTNMKYQGVKQMLATTMPTITSGLPVPSTFKSTQTAGYSNNFATSKMICANPSDVNSDWYFINSPVAGSYNIKLTTKGAISSIATSVKVNNVSVGNLTLALNGSSYVSSSTLAFNLPAGLSTIQISYTGVDRNKGCLNIEDIIIASTGVTANSKTDFNNDISVYPNPATDYIKINLSNILSDSKSTITLCDLMGKIIYKNDVYKVSNLSIPTNGISKGIYILNITNGSNKYNKKVVIQ